MSRKTIVCYGDSNTHGYCARNGGRFDETKRWPCLLEEFLGGEYLVREEGLNGRTIAFDDPLFEGLNGCRSLGSVLLTHEPVDLLVVMLGTNDTKTRFHATAGNIRTGLEHLILKALRTPEAFRDGKMNLLVVCPPPIDPRYETTSIGGEMGEGCAEKSAALAPLFELTCRSLGVHFLDAGSLPGVEMAHYDWMHLSERSHRNLAEALAERIPALL